MTMFTDKIDFELSEKFQRIDFEIEQALHDVGYHRRRFSEDTVRPISNRDYSMKNSLHPGCSEILKEDSPFSAHITSFENGSRMSNTSAQGLPSNGHDTAKNVTCIKPAHSRKMITDSTSVMITNAATNKYAIIRGGQNHSTPASVQGGQKRRKSSLITETSTLPKPKLFSPRKNNSSEHQDFDLSPTGERLEKPSSPRSNHDLFVKLSRPKSPAPKLLTTEILSPRGQDRPKSADSNSHQGTLSPRQSKPVSHFVTPSKGRPRSNSLVSNSYRRTVNESASLESSAVVFQRPRSSTLSPRLTQRANTAHKYEKKETDVTDSSPGRFCGSTVYLKYSVTSPRRNPIQYRKNISFGAASGPFPRKDKDPGVPRIVVTDWDTCTNQQLLYLDTGSNSNVEHISKDSENDVRRRNSDPGNLDGFNESDAHYQAMFLDRRRSSFGDKLQLSNRIGLDIDNLVCR